MDEDGRLGVLLVCLGNICRSPMAEGILRHKLEARGLDDRFFVDSAGISAVHAGEPADPRTLEVLGSHGIEHQGTARQVTDADFERFEWILAMDRKNLRELKARCPEALRDRLRLVLDPTSMQNVRDPYDSGLDAFERNYRELDLALNAWIDRMVAR